MKKYRCEWFGTRVEEHGGPSMGGSEDRGGSEGCHHRGDDPKKGEHTENKLASGLQEGRAALRVQNHGASPR